MIESSLAPEMEIDKRLKELADSREVLLDKLEALEVLENEEYLILESTEERLEALSRAIDALLRDIEALEDECTTLEALKTP